MALLNPEAGRKKNKRKSKPTALHLLYMRIKILKFTANASRFCNARESYEAVSPWVSMKVRKEKVHCNSRLTSVCPANYTIRKILQNLIYSGL